MRLRCAFFTISLFAAATAVAQSPWDTPNPDSVWDRDKVDVPWEGPSPEGNWIFEYHDYPERGDVARVPLSIRAPHELTCEPAPGGGCFLRLAPVAGAAWEVKRGEDPGGVHAAQIPRASRGGMLWFDHPYFFPLERAQSKFRPSGEGEMRGEWWHGSVRDGEPSLLVLRRQPGRIAKVKFISSVESETAPGSAPARVTVGYDPVYWDARTPAYAPQFTVEVYGENLWGHHHVVHFPRDVDMLTSVPQLVFADGAAPAAEATIGLRFTVWLLGERPGKDRDTPKATPGRKTLLVDGVAIPFDLTITGFPGDSDPPKATVTALRYVELRDGKYIPVEGELKQGSLFFVEAAFDAPPAEAEYSVALSWGDGESQVTVAPSGDDPKVFRSGAIRLEAPATER